MLDKVIFRVVAFIILISILWLSWCGIITLLGDRQKDVPSFHWGYKEYYEAYNVLYEELYTNICNFTNKQYREYVEKDMGLRFYVYKEKDLHSQGLDGLTDAIIRTIWIDETIKGSDYCETFVHEAIHLKQSIKDETYVCYETFKYLYEDEVLHNIGVIYGWQQLTVMKPSEYNIREQVIYYLTQK